MKSGDSLPHFVGGFCVLALLILFMFWAVALTTIAFGPN